MKNHSLMQINDAGEIHIGVDLLNIEEMRDQLQSLLRAYLNLKIASKLNQFVGKLMTTGVIIC